ncbi:MAG: glycosyltransferase [Methanomassiliicoccales archaeon]|nr:glycosyltransferase [Methanomassiliicoccales archaeon]
MICGRPLIGAASGGTPKLIENGKNEFLYSPGSSDQLASFIEFLHDNPHKCKEMGLNAREFAVKSFSRDRFISSMREIADDLSLIS